MIYVAYNPLSNNKCGEKCIGEVKEKLKGEKAEFFDATKVTDIPAFLGKLTSDDKLIICGGDGTMNRFINSSDGCDIPCDVLFYHAGSGNDFFNDMGGAADSDGMIHMNEYIKNLPVVSVNGKNYRFFNGIGYGIDGYCCEIGDELKKKSDKPINYAGIAIKGLLFHFKSRNAIITVDGVSKEYKNVWLAPTMNGRYYGGGMNIAPAQDRTNEKRKVSNVVLHCGSKLKTLIVFPSIFKGEHIKHTEMVDIRTGNEVKVEFDRPTALQIDGETILGVTSYTVKSGVNIPLSAPEKQKSKV